MPGPLEPIAAAGRFAGFVGAIAGRGLVGRTFWGEAVGHLWTTTSRCLLPVCAVTLPFGMVVALQGLQIFHIFGAERMLPSLVSVAILRELSPVLSSVLVAAQGGSSCAAALGAMRIKEELDATEVMAVDSLRYHVVPRVIALTLACPILHIFGSTAGLVGAWITAVPLKGENGGIFLAELWNLSTPADLWGGLLKTTVFGAIIGLVASWHGYRVQGGAAGVGRAVNDTVVHSVLAFVIVNYLLTTALFGQVSA